jgi:GNAT superfamily N-acetyltransferase
MKASSFQVRQATPEDNVGLRALDREGVIAAATPVTFDRSPDFFAPSCAYASWRAYVAEKDSRLIGVGAMALKPVLVDGVPVQAAYFYDLRVAPDVRRQGIAKAVGEAIRDYTRSLTPAIGYSLVMEGNDASLGFVQDRGSRALRSCALSLLPIEKIPITDSGRLRPLEETETGSAFRLVRETHSGHDLLPFIDLASFHDRMGILEPAGEWSWTAGRDLHLVFLLPLGFRGPDGVPEAVRLAAARLRQDRAPAAARVLAVPHDLADPVYATLDEFRPIRLGFTLFGLDLRGAGTNSLGSRPVYVDPADL